MMPPSTTRSLTRSKRKARTSGSRKGRPERFLKARKEKLDLPKWEQVKDVCDVWFDSGSTHAFMLEDAQAFPGFKGIARKSRVEGGQDRVMYLEGSDQHRGWFHSSLARKLRHARRSALRHRADARLHPRRKGRRQDVEVARATSLSPQDVMETVRRRYSAALGGGLRLVQRHPHRHRNRARRSSETYRKLRNTLRWMLGALAHFKPGDAVKLKDMPFELERLMLHRLSNSSTRSSKPTGITISAR